MKKTAILAALFACLTFPAHASIDCTTIKKAIDQYGQEFVESQAKAMGYSDAQIRDALKKCTPAKAR